MNRKLVSFFTFLLISIMLVSVGAGCGEPSVVGPLKSNWDKYHTASLGFKEYLSYTVSYDANASIDGFNYSKNEDLDKFVDISYADGSFTSYLTIVGANQVDKNKESDILPSLKDTARIIHLITSFKITAKYVVDNEEKTFNDFVNTESYFLAEDMYLAPIYSMTENNYATLTVGDKCEISTSHFVHTVNYNRSSYSVKTEKYKYGEPLEEINLISSGTETFSYKFNTVIDNTSLIFASRNLDVASDKTASVPVVTGVYGKAKSVVFSHNADTTIKDAKGTSYPVKRFAFGNGDSSFTGRAQLIFIQSENDSVNTNRAYPIKMITPLVEYSTFYRCMGALVYTLSSVS